MLKKFFIFFTLVFLSAFVSSFTFQNDEDTHNIIFALDDADLESEKIIKQNKLPEKIGGDTFSITTIFSSFLIKKWALPCPLKWHLSLSNSSKSPFYLLFHSFLFYE